MNAQRALLDDGRWHFQHGPIDLVIGADGDAAAVEAAHAAAWARFDTVLGELVAELPALRLPIRGPCPLRGAIARRITQPGGESVRLTGWHQPHERIRIQLVTAVVLKVRSRLRLPKIGTTFS